MKYKIHLVSSSIRASMTRKNYAKIGIPLKTKSVLKSSYLRNNNQIALNIVVTRPQFAIEKWHFTLFTVVDL
uniref:Uncharacterized protein n=1 Tax=Rhizophagus irregularis (strain DAOM 181602 / DAOM 197198 / MUCL 43194) TaxID=747089 RepID=U9TWG9_RHIID